MQKERLLDEFPTPTYEQWLSLIEDKLKVRETREGIGIQPIYTRADIKVDGTSLSDFSPFVRGTKTSGYVSSGLGIGAHFSHPSPAEFNKAVRYDISQGAKTISISLDQSISNLQDLSIALDGIDFSTLSLQINAGIAVLPFTNLMLAFMESKRIPFCEWKGGLNFDPVGFLTTKGEINRPIEDLYDEMAYLTRWTRQYAPKLQTIGVNTYSYCEKGVNAVRELAISMATGVEYLRRMRERGLEIDDIAPNVRFSFLMGQNFYTGIAKLRAARVLWAQIVAAFGGNETSQKMMIHAESNPCKTRHDPHLNIVRTAIGAFSSLAGNCDSLTLVPFDETSGLSDEISRRVARNTQIILREECHADKVIDPAGGSWFVEYVTDQLGRKAWALFQEIEKEGGIMEALKKGLTQEK